MEDPMTDKTPSPNKPDETIPQTAEDFLQAGWRRYAAGSFLEAEVEFRKAVELDGSRADAWYGVAMAFLRSGKSIEGLEMLLKAKTVNIENPGSQEPRHQTMLNLVIDSQLAILKQKKGAGV
jgi:Tfp pilus assembly protein PilF